MITAAMREAAARARKVAEAETNCDKWMFAFSVQSRKLQAVLHIPGVKEALVPLEHERVDKVLGGLDSRPQQTDAPTHTLAEARSAKATEDDKRLRRIAWSAAQRWGVYEEGDSLLDRDDVAYLKAFPPSVALALLDRVSALSLPPPEAKDGAAPSPETGATEAMVDALLAVWWGSDGIPPTKAERAHMTTALNAALYAAPAAPSPDLSAQGQAGKPVATEADIIADLHNQLHDADERSAELYAPWTARAVAAEARLTTARTALEAAEKALGLTTPTIDLPYPDDMATILWVRKFPDVDHMMPGPTVGSFRLARAILSTVSSALATITEKDDGHGRG